MTDQTQGSPSSPDVLTTYRLGTIEKTLESISDSLKTLTALEQSHCDTRDKLERAFAAIKVNDDRLRILESEMPIIKLTSKWVIGGVVTVIGLTSAAVFKLFAFVPMPH